MSAGSGKDASDGASPRLERLPPTRRAEYPHFDTIDTRWADNDRYGHVNNAVYYFYFDTVINRYLIGPGGLDIEKDPVIAITAETGARFHRSFAYPERIEAGLRVARLTERSVRYEIGLFAAGEERSRVDGHFVHVFVDRATMRPTQMPARMREALGRLLVAPAT